MKQGQTEVPSEEHTFRGSAGPTVAPASTSGRLMVPPPAQAAGSTWMGNIHIGMVRPRGWRLHCIKGELPASREHVNSETSRQSDDKTLLRKAELPARLLWPRYMPRASQCSAVRSRPATSATRWSAMVGNLHDISQAACSMADAACDALCVDASEPIHR